MSNLVVCCALVLAVSVSPAEIAASHSISALIFLSLLSSNSLFLSLGGLPSKIMHGLIPLSTKLESLKKRPLRWLVTLPSESVSKLPSA